MNYFILSLDQKNLLIQDKAPFDELHHSRGVDLMPIEIQGNLFILPLEVFTDENYREFKQFLTDNHKIDNPFIREVLETEFITIPL
ncbi:MAG: hypothetical protein A3F72_15270 [Bacteroidetes bacterium RIFCSPLOWO2_12_FULL_35_15]|nr:MAG: hypothetical protein A3F72_15270 [Bacteroidetes bacterium RIFCSPLOWO2_12_FULL_35_15]